MFRTIIVAYDGSEHARRALATGCAVAKAFGAELHLAHAPQLETPTAVVGAFVGALETPPTKEQIDEAGGHVAEEARALAEGFDAAIAKAHIGRGDPAAHTLAAAKAANADLIVMGRRGLGAVGALALGSVSQAVAHGAPCACMTVA